MKVCFGCKLNKDESEFSPRSDRENKLTSRCKSCVNIYNRQYHKKRSVEQKSRIKERVSKFRKENISKLLEYLKNNPCVLCNETNPIVLEFDHINPEDKRSEVAKLVHHASWETVKLEIDKCRVLCANCHRIHTAKQMDWYMLKLIDGMV